MGRMILIVVLGFIVIFGNIRNNLNKTAEKAIDNASEYAAIVMREELTNSALEYGISSYLQTGNSDTSIVDTSWLEGTITVDIALQGRDSTNFVDTVVVTATSQLYGVTESSHVMIISRSLIIPPITAAVGVESQSSLFGLIGHSRIYGNDTNMDGTTGSSTNLAGISVSNSADSTTWSNVYSGTTYIQGDGPSPSFSVSDDPTTDLQESVDYFSAIADQTKSNCFGLDGGSEASPTIAHINGNCFLFGRFSGYGVLVVEGSLTMLGRIRWYGIVIVVDSGTANFITAGSSAIYGGLMLGAPRTNLFLAGSPDLYYSSEAIQMVQTGLENSDNNRRFIKDFIWWE